jgi:hypothetical protein
VDWNNDGLRDLIVGECWGRVKLYTAITADSLVEMEDLKANGVYINGGMTVSPLVTDWNNDGLLDLILGCMTAGTGSSVRLFINTGSAGNPVLSDGQNVLIDGNGIELFAATPQMADLNQDGLLDLIIGEMNGGVYYAENTGTANSPVFTELVQLECSAGVISQGHNTSPFVTDWDEDGYPDLLLGNDKGLVYLFLSPYTGINSGGSESRQFFITTVQNPCMGVMSVEITLPSPASAFLTVHSIEGRLVYSCDLGLLPEGRTTVNAEAIEAEPGLYFCTCRSGGNCVSAPVVVIGGNR